MKFQILCLRSMLHLRNWNEKKVPNPTVFVTYGYYYLQIGPSNFAWSHFGHIIYLCCVSFCGWMGRFGWLVLDCIACVLCVLCLGSLSWMDGAYFLPVLRWTRVRNYRYSYVFRIAPLHFLDSDVWGHSYKIKFYSKMPTRCRIFRLLILNLK